MQFKNLFISSFVVLSLSCSSGSKKVKLNKESLLGTWVVTSLYKTDKDITALQGLSLNAITGGNEVLNVYQFNTDNSFVLDTGSAVVLKGTFNTEDTIITIKGDTSYKAKRYYTATEITDSSMYLVTDFPDDSKGKLVYAIVKINTKENGELANPNWKTPLSNTASDKEISTKLVAVLNHYENYYTALNKAGAKVFSQAKLLLPLTLYSGAVGTKNLTETPDGFTQIFGSKENAEKALLKLRNAFSVPFDYPANPNYAIGYIAAFRHLAKNIQ